MSFGNKTYYTKASFRIITHAHVDIDAIFCVCGQLARLGIEKEEIYDLYQKKQILFVSNLDNIEFDKENAYLFDIGEDKHKGMRSAFEAHFKGDFPETIIEEVSLGDVGKETVLRKMLMGRRQYKVSDIQLIKEFYLMIKGLYEFEKEKKSAEITILKKLETGKAKVLTLEDKITFLVADLIEFTAAEKNYANEFGITVGGKKKIINGIIYRNKINGGVEKYGIALYPSGDGLVDLSKFDKLGEGWYYDSFIISYGTRKSSRSEPCQFKSLADFIIWIIFQFEKHT